MFVSALFLAAAAQINPIVIPFGKPPPAIERPRAPIETAGPMWASACEGAQDVNKPAPPVGIHGNTYLVGTCGLSSILIVGDQGDVLIDGGTAEAADSIAANIRSLGFRVQDIRFVLTGHEHFDHAGGIAQLQRMSGATVVTSAPAAKVLATGVPSPDDPQFGLVKTFPPVVAGRIVGDGDEVRLGNIMLTAMTTPGHAAGSLSWRWVSCDGGVCRMIVYADVLSPVSNSSYRFNDHPAVVAALRSSLAKIADSPCEILVTPRPPATPLAAQLGLGRPLLDTNACKTYAAASTKLLDDRLATESAPSPPKP